MAIQNVGSINEILNNYDSKSWTKSVDLEEISHLNTKTIGGGKEKSFTEMLSDSISSVNNLQVEANKAIEKLATGKTKNLHETMLAVEKADIAFKSMNQIRMKVIDAYKEIMRMQV